LYGVTCGRAPRFLEGNEAAFTELYFDVVGDVFEFYASAKMSKDPASVAVSALLYSPGRIGPYIVAMTALEAEHNQSQGTYLARERDTARDLPQNNQRRANTRI
jgi:hypothetical protein